MPGKGLVPEETCGCLSGNISGGFRRKKGKSYFSLTHVNEGFCATPLPRRLTIGRTWRICERRPRRALFDLPDETRAPFPQLPAPGKSLCAVGVMDAGVSTAAAVSRLDSAPALGLSEWLAAARPVIGAIAASSLMLLACSWFAFGSGVLGSGRDVGRPDPVRIGTTPQLVGGPSGTAAQPGAHGRVDVGNRQPSRSGAAASTREVRQTSESGPEPVAPAATGPGPASTRAPAPSLSPASPATAQSESSASPAPTPVVPDDVTSSLPAALDHLPSVPLPPVTSPVTVPDLSAPAASTATTILGVP